MVGKRWSLAVCALSCLLCGVWEPLGAFYQSSDGEGEAAPPLRDDQKLEWSSVDPPGATLGPGLALGTGSANVTVLGLLMSRFHPW